MDSDLPSSAQAGAEFMLCNFTPWVRLPRLTPGHETESACWSGRFRVESRDKLRGPQRRAGSAPTACCSAPCLRAPAVTQPGTLETRALGWNPPHRLRCTLNTGVNGQPSRDVPRAIPVPSRKLKGIIHSEAVNLTFSYVNYRERKMQPMRTSIINAP